MSNGGLLPTDGQTITFNPNDSSFTINNQLNQANNGRPLIPEVRTAFQPATYGDTTILPLRNNHPNNTEHTLASNDMITITKCPPGTQPYTMESCSRQQEATSTTTTAPSTSAAGPVRREEQISIGFRPCNAQLAAKSESELRRKGTSFLRTHASKHGIINSSRKRLDNVVQEISQHCLIVHKFALIPDSGEVTERPPTTPTIKKETPKAPIVKSEPQQTAVTAASNVSIIPTTAAEQQSNAFMLSAQLQDFQNYLQPNNLYPALQSLAQAAPGSGFAYQNPAAASVAQHQVQLPLHPLPPHHTPNEYLQSPDYQTRVLNANSSNVLKKTTKPSSVKVKQEVDDTKPFCNSPIVAKTKGELSCFGTSKLRPQASAHKVFNSSRKTKQEVVEELWAHYETHHADEIDNVPQQSSMAAAAAAAAAAQQAVFQQHAVQQAVQQHQQQQQHHQHQEHHRVVFATAQPISQQGWVGHIADDEEENSAHTANDGVV